MNADMEVFFLFLHFSEMLIIRTHYRAKITVRETTYISFSLKNVCILISQGLFQGFLDGAPWGIAGGRGQIPHQGAAAQTGISNLNWDVGLQSMGGRICPKTHIQAAGLHSTGLGTISVNSGHKY